MRRVALCAIDLARRVRSDLRLRRFTAPAYRRLLHCALIVES